MDGYHFGITKLKINVTAWLFLWTKLSPDTLSSPLITSAGGVSCSSVTLNKIGAQSSSWLQGMIIHLQLPIYAGLWFYPAPIINVSSDFLPVRKNGNQEYLDLTKAWCHFVDDLLFWSLKSLKNWAFLNQSFQGHRLWWDSISYRKKITYLNWLLSQPLEEITTTVDLRRSKARSQQVTSTSHLLPGKVFKTRKLRRIGLSFMILSFLNNAGLSC